MGERPLLDTKEAERSLGTPRLVVDRRVSRVRLAPRRVVELDEYCAREADMLARLARGDTSDLLVDARPYPEIARAYHAAHDGTQLGVALAWFGDALAGPIGVPRARPWRVAFDRAEAASPTSGDPEAILLDAIADELWSLAWHESTLDEALRVLGLRLHVSRTLRDTIVRLGARPDRAAAEAVTIVELAMLSEESRFLTAAIGRGKVGP